MVLHNLKANQSDTLRTTPLSFPAASTGGAAEDEEAAYRKMNDLPSIQVKKHPFDSSQVHVHTNVTISEINK